MIGFNEVRWKEFAFDEIFDVVGGYYNNKPKSDSLTDNKIPFVAASVMNNGVTTYIDMDDIYKFGISGNINNTLNGKIFPSGCITVANDGNGVGKAFYQMFDFTCSHSVNVLIPRFVINEYIAIFICNIIDLERFKYSYGRKWRSGKFKKSTIKLPSTDSGDPDWQFMEDYIKQFEETKLLEIQETDYKDNVKLPSVDEWGSFRFDELFTISRGRLAKKPSDIGEVPYISSSGMNNGLNESFDINSKYIVRADLSPVITVANNGSVGSTFVQEFSFAASSDVSVLEPIFNSNADALFFIKVVIERSKNLYGYGRKWGLEKMRSSIIKLPVLENGEPDWILIERYMRSLPYSEMI